MRSPAEFPTRPNPSLPAREQDRSHNSHFSSILICLLTPASSSLSLTCQPLINSAMFQFYITLIALPTNWVALLGFQTKMFFIADGYCTTVKISQISHISHFSKICTRSSKAFCALNSSFGLPPLLFPF